MEIDENEDFLLELDHYYQKETYYFLTSRGLPFTVHSPEYDESVKDISVIINKIERAIYQANSTKYFEYIDIDSFVKYYWLQEVSRNSDTMQGSNFFYYVSSEGKLYAVPVWDMDNTLRIWHESNLDPEVWQEALQEVYEAAV